jgi:hypothetical protein
MVRTLTIQLGRGHAYLGPGVFGFSYTEIKIGYNRRTQKCNNNILTVFRPTRHVLLCTAEPRILSRNHDVFVKNIVSTRGIYFILIFRNTCWTTVVRGILIKIFGKHNLTTTGHGP